MQLIFDNLIAVIVFGMITLMLMTAYMRNQSVKVEAAGAYALRAQQVAFISILRRDIAGMICDEENLATCPDFEVDPVDHTYTFHTRLGGVNSTLHKVTYKRRTVGESDGEDRYQIQRYVDASGSLDPGDYDGGSMPTITNWSVRAVNEDGNTPTKKGDIRRIKVHFEAVPPYSMDAQPHPWEATYRPMYLRNSTL